MLIRQTFLYLPAQLLPPLAQFVSLIVWSHFASAEVIGIVTLLVSIQEFLVLGLMGFWTNYTIRYASKALTDPKEIHEQAATCTAVVFGSSLIQALLGVILYLTLINAHTSPVILATAAIMVFGRSFNSFQAERGRGRGDVLLYSIGVMAGPVIGMGVGVALLTRFGSSELAIFFGFAVAQLAAVLFGLARDRSWFALGRPSIEILGRALRYGLPLILSAVSIWLTQNIARLLVSHFSGLAAAGVYALGFGLGFRVAVVAAMSVTAAAFPIAVRYSHAGEHDRAMEQLSRNVTLLMIVLAPSMTGLAMIAKDVLTIFIAQPLREPVYPIMLWSILAGSIICFRQHFLHQVFLLKGNTHVIGKVSLAEAAIALLAAFFAVPKWGGLGGIISLTASSSLSTAVMMAFALRAGLRPPWLDLGKITAASIAMAGALSFVPEAADIGHLVWRIGVGGLAFALALSILYAPYLVRLAGNRKITAQ